MRHFSVGLVTESGEEISAETGLMTRKAANRRLLPMRDSGRHKARRSRSELRLMLTEHLGSCRGCTGIEPNPGCRVLDEQRIR